MCSAAESALREITGLFMALKVSLGRLSSLNGNPVPTMQMPLQTDSAFFPFFSSAHQLSPPLAKPHLQKLLSLLLPRFPAFNAADEGLY